MCKFIVLLAHCDCEGGIHNKESTQRILLQNKTQVTNNRQ